MPNLLLICVLLFSVLGILFALNLKYSYSSAIYFGLFVHLFFILTGILITTVNNKTPVFHEQGIYSAILLEKPQEKTNSYKSRAEITAVFKNDSIIGTSEKIIIYFAKDSVVKGLQAGQVILIGKTPQTININNKGNPYEFDYRKYLSLQKIYRQVFVSDKDWQTTGKSVFSLSSSAEKIRDKLLDIYRTQKIDSTEFEILAALTLGYTRELDPETKQVFSQSGTMHVLSVSGLHVAIIFWVINLLFGFFKKFKNGKAVFTIVTLSLLWFYAFITGLSPSVLRSTAMFSIFILGENLQRKPQIYNSLAASAFILLLINPNNLFDVGFQLSYAALFGIVFLQPKFENLIKIQHKTGKYFWSLLTVSFAAQITTFPITTWYFGQFPTYFWLSNLFIIPAVAFLTPAGIGLLFVSKFPFISGIVSFIVNYSIKIVFSLLEMVDRLPFAVLQSDISLPGLIFLGCAFFTIFVFLENGSVNYLKSFLLFILFLSISSFYIDFNQRNSKQVIVYNYPENPMLHILSGKDNYLISEKKIDTGQLYFEPFLPVVKKMKLNPPVFLCACDTFSDNRIKLNDRLIGFNDKIIVFGGSYWQNSSLFPDYLINSESWPDSSILKTGVKLIFTGNPGKLAEVPNETDAYFTRMSGAFVAKW